MKWRGDRGVRVELRHGELVWVRRRAVSDDLRTRTRLPLGFVRDIARRADPFEMQMLRDMGEELGHTGLVSFRPPARRDIEHLVETLERAFECGELIAVRNDPPPTPAPARFERSAPPPDPQPPRPQKPPKTLHSFAVRWVDEIGQSIPGVGLEIDHASKEGKTADGNGVARIEDSPATAATARVTNVSTLKKPLKPRWDTVRNRRWLTAADGVTVIQLQDDALPVLDLEADKLRVVSVQPCVLRVRLIGGFFDSNKCFVLPAGLQGVRGIVSMYQQRNPSKLLLVGHTDTTGTPDSNDVLSLERAEALRAYLANDVDSWLAWYDAVEPAQKRWGTPEDRAMIGALPDADQRGPGEAPVLWYQRARGLEADGVAGPVTRRSLIGEYMALEGTSLPAGITPVTHGCGENFPRDPTGEGVDDPDNRRVETFFFAEDLGIQPPPPGKNSARGSPQYPEWVKRAKETADYAAQETRVAYAVRVVDENDRPLEGVEVSISTPTGMRTVKTDADGLAQVGDAPAGTGSAQLSTLDTLRGLFADHAMQPRRQTSFPASEAVTLLTLKGAADPVALVGGITQTLMIVTRVDLFQDGQYDWQSLSLEDDGPYYLVPDVVGRLQMHSDAAGRSATVLGRPGDAAAPASGSDAPVWARCDVDSLHNAVFAGDVETMLAFLRDLPIDPDEDDSRAPEGGGPPADVGDDGSDPARELA
ncbi:MAG: hypothetical protein M3O36_09160 [Myxococcota bacterium]|nr:hypothetical protein [Myxococcota bacterium]